VIVSIKDLVVRRGARTVIDGFALEVPDGEVVGIVGANGCGKSTLVMAIAGVLAPTEGKIVIAGHDVWGGMRHRNNARRMIGYVPEAADPPGFLLGGELWAMVAAARKAPPPTKELISTLGLDELRDTALERMSLGQRRRACIGAALIGEPRLLVLDEPDNGLDAKHAGALVDVLLAHKARNGSAIVATHDRGLLERVNARTVELYAAAAAAG
jgi:ABC-2 type transport system ATP-binding protein